MGSFVGAYVIPGGLFQAYMIMFLFFVGLGPDSVGLYAEGAVRAVSEQAPGWCTDRARGHCRRKRDKKAMPLRHGVGHLGPASHKPCCDPDQRQ